MRFLWAGSLGLAPCLLAEAQQTSAAPQTSSSTGPNRRSVAFSTAPKARAPAKPSAPRARVPVRQLRPTRERYAEIQQALADAGYFSGPANGAWEESSVKALRAFQTDQGLEPTGKIDALTLIRLNLGPRYDTPQENASSGASPRH